MNPLFADYSIPEASARVPVSDEGIGCDEVIRRLEVFGFAVAALPYSDDGEERLKLLASLLDLGRPYIPELYRMPGAGSASEYVHIRPSGDERHPSFTSRSGQGFHTDGLLEDIHVIKTSLLYCVNPAASGGRTIVFNAAGALETLRAAHPEAADLMFAEHIHGRRATLPGIDVEKIGPAFAYAADGELLTRYGDNEPVTWYPADGEEELLEVALKHFRLASAQDGPLRASVRLDRGECLILLNNRVSHARGTFEDAEDAPRHLVRTLHTEFPSLALTRPRPI